MRVLALALLVAFGTVVDPADSVQPPVEVDSDSVDSDRVDASVRVVRVNGVIDDGKRIWPLDDVVVSAAGSRAVSGVRSYAWLLVRKPPQSRVFLASDDAMETSFVFDLKDRRVAGLDEAGDYVVRVTVTSMNNEKAVEEHLVHVAWPGGKTSLPKPDASSSPGSAATSMGVGALTGCCAGAAVMGVGAALAGGATGAGIVCVLGMCPCATAGALLGGGGGAIREHVDVADLSPWVLSGAVVEVLGITTLLGAGLAAAYFTLPSTSPPIAAPVDQSVLFVVGGVGLMVMAAGGPITVVAAYATAPNLPAKPPGPDPR